MVVETESRRRESIISFAPQNQPILPDQTYRLWLELDLSTKSIRDHNSKRVMFSLSEEILERHQIRVCEILEELGLTPDQANRKKSRMLKKIKRETGLESHQTGMYLVNQEHD